MLNQCNFIGNLGRDPEIKYASNGNAIANLSLGVSESWKNKDGEKQEKTEWVRVSVFGKLAEICGSYLKKGSKVYVSGKYTTTKYQNKEGVDVYSTSINVSGFGGVLKMLDSKGEGQPKQEFVPQTHDPITPVGADSAFEDDSIPF